MSLIIPDTAPLDKGRVVKGWVNKSSSGGSSSVVHSVSMPYKQRKGRGAPTQGPLHRFSPT